MKQINMEWMQSLLNDDKKETQQKSNLPTIDWVQNGKAFKRDIKFKLIAGNSKENNIFSTIVGQHWNLGPNKDQRIICTETTSHLKNLNIPCPICEAKRKLLAMGFKEEDLTTEGKYGPVPVFDPTITSNIKVVMLGTDLKTDWDQAHISILQQKGTYLTRWLIEKYMDAETPDLLQWEDCNVIRFSRATDNGKWEREVTFGKFSPDAATIAKLKEENEGLTLSDIWKTPSDEELLKMREVAENMIGEYKKAKEMIDNPSSASTITDSMPF